MPGQTGDVRSVWVLIALTGSAYAGDGESAVSASVGWSTYATPNAEEDATLSPTFGGGLAGTYERGFGDYASWRVHAAGAVYGGGGVAATDVVTAGLTYRVDAVVLGVKRGRPSCTSIPFMSRPRRRQTASIAPKALSS